MKSKLYLLVFAFFMSNCAKDSENKEAEAVSNEEQAQPDSPTEPEAKQTAKQEALNFKAERIFFDFDKYNIKTQFENGLQELAAILKEHKLNLTVEGHCDQRGTTEYNLGLGNRRADSVKQYLMALGVSEQQITTVSYGEERPLVDEQTLQAYSSNRRAEFSLNP
jgi:peptidoglycan-associated lipoprotein